MKPETKAEGKPENLQDTEVKQQSKKKKNQWIKEEIKRVRKFCQKIKNILRQMKTQHTKPMGCCKTVLRGKLTAVNVCIKKRRKISNY